MSVNNSYNMKYSNKNNTSNYERLNKLTDKLNVSIEYRDLKFNKFLE